MNCKNNFLSLQDKHLNLSQPYRLYSMKIYRGTKTTPKNTPDSSSCLSGRKYVTVDIWQSRGAEEAWKQLSYKYMTTVN